MSFILCSRLITGGVYQLLQKFLLSAHLYMDSKQFNTYLKDFFFTPRLAMTSFITTEDKKKLSLQSQVKIMYCCDRCLMQEKTNIFTLRYFFYLLLL